LALAFASVAVVLTAAAVSKSDRWNFDFAQYRGPDRPEPKDEFRFVLVGDRNGGRVPGLMPQAFREINHLYPDFVVCVGDLIDGPTNLPDRIPTLWKEFDDEVGLLKSPFVYVPGNHDIWNTTSKGIYETRYGPTYRSFNYRGLHFITLDTEEMDEQGRKIDRIDGKQLEWLKDDIARHRDARRILVLLHKPIWLHGGLNKAEEVWKGLPVHVFAGHDHRYSYTEINGIPHVILGAVAGGMREEGDAIGRFRHYALATVRDNDLKLALIRLGGVLAPEVVLEDELPGIRQLADAVALYRDGSGGAARLAFRNPLDMPVSVQLQRTSRTAAPGTLFKSDEVGARPLGVGGTLLTDLDRAALDKPGSADVEYRATFRFTNARGEPQVIDYPVEPRARRSATASRAGRAPNIDGDLADWSEAQWQTLNESRQVTLGAAVRHGDDDLHGRFALRYDDEHLYVAVQVRDENVAFNTQATEGDGVELYFASPVASEITFPRDTDWHRLVVTPFTGDGTSAGEAAGKARIQQFGAQTLAEVRAAYARGGTGYAIELAVPWRELGWRQRPDARTQFDLALNDRDLGPRRESQLTWSGTDRNAFGSKHYGQVTMTP
jgi:hypothetical protein